MSEEEKRINEEKVIDIKGTFKQFVKADEPEMSQEEAITKYTESTSTGSSDDENSEEQEHLKRIKQELLAALERVRNLEKQLYDQKEKDEKKNLKIEKASSLSGTSVKIEKEQEVTQQKERE